MKKVDDSSYEAFIAELERKRLAEQPGRVSYFDVFNETSRLVGHLKKGLNTSFHRERVSEVRVAAQIWQHSSANDDRSGRNKHNSYSSDPYGDDGDGAGSRVDILDWQPRYAALDPSDDDDDGEGGGGAAASPNPSHKRPSKSAAAGSPSASGAALPQRRSHTSPPARRPGHSVFVNSGGNGSGGGGGSLQPMPVQLPPPAIHLPAATDRASSEPLSPAYRAGHPYGTGSGSVGASTAGGALGDAAARGAHVSPGCAQRGTRRATDSLLPRSRRGPAPAGGQGGGGRGGGGGGSAPGLDGRLLRSDPHMQHPQDPDQEAQQLAAEEGDEEDEDSMTLAVRERSFLGGAGQAPRRLPPLEEPSGPLSPSAGPHGGSRADEAIRLFARAAYEPGERRHSMLLLPPEGAFEGLGGGGGGGGSGSGGGDGPASPRRHLEPLPLAPIPRTVPRRVTEALSSLAPLPAAAGARSPAASGQEAGGADGYGYGDSGGGGGGGNWGGGRGRRESVSGLAASPRQSSATLGRGRPSWIQQPPPQQQLLFQPHPPDEPAMGTHPRAPGCRVRVSGNSFTAGTSPLAGGGGGDRPQPQLPSGHANRRVSVPGPLSDLDSPTGHGSPSPSRSHRGVSAAASAMGMHNPRGGARAARMSYSGTGTGGGGGARSSYAGGAGSGERGRPLSATASGLIWGYAGGGPLDHRILDVVPRLGLEAPRVKTHGGDVPYEDVRRSLAAAPAGLADVRHPPHPDAAAIRARRASCTGVPAAGAADYSAAHPGVSRISLGPMLVTREQVDSYHAVAQGPGQAQGGIKTGRSKAVSSSPRPAVVQNVIGMRGCLTDESVPQGPRTLRREVALSETSTAGAAAGKVRFG